MAEKVKRPFAIGWFSTGRDQAARELLQTVIAAIEQGEIAGEIAFVFSNREPGENPHSDRFFALVRDHRLPLICFSSAHFRRRWSGQPPEPQWREEYDGEVIARLEAFAPDICVLAGYMLIVSPRLCYRFKMINLHPAAPGGPTGTWQEVIWQLIESRAASSGVLMHLVTPELDKGPPVAFCRYSLRGGGFDPLWPEIEERSIAEIRSRSGEDYPLFRLIRAEGLKREFPLLVHTIGALSQGRVKIEDGQVVDETGNPIPGYDLTEEIDRAVGRSSHAGKRG